ncbi:MAG: Fe-S cluster assembly protein SufD [Terriglobales bacterium]
MPLFGLKDATSGVFATYMARFAGQDPRPAWLHELRQEAFARFSELGFPHHKMEGWRQTNVAPIAMSVFEAQPPLPPAQLVPRVRDLDLPGVDWSPDAPRLVFVNGAFAPGLSSTRLPQGCRMGSLGERFASGEHGGEDLRPYFDFEDERKQAFVALNTSFLADGAWIEIAPRAVLDKPISILYVTTGSPEHRGVSHPRTLVLAGSECQCRIVETCAGFDGDVYLTNAVTAIEVAANAQVEYTRLEQESRSAFHVSKLRARQGRDSRFTAHSIALGGSLVRNNVHSILDGEGSECLLNGLFALDGAQHVDNSTLLDHAKPLGTSREYYKGVLDDTSAGVFNGRIIVRQDAQHTDAIQSSKNLLLSDSAATINTQPELEIYADDVRCTHGGTVGQLDTQALFYLRSRGLGEEESRKLLIYAFAADVLSRIQVPQLRESLEAVLWRKWAQ